MPGRMITAPAGLFGTPLPLSGGANEQIVIEAVNNSGDFLYYGDVVTWENGGSFGTAPTTLTISGDQSGTLASFTLTASASTASYNASGGLIVLTTVTGSADAPVPVFYSYTALSGSTFTGVKAHTASITNGLDAGDSIYQYNTTTSMTGFTGLPSNYNYVQPVRGLVAMTTTAVSDGGRYVKLSITGAVSDPLVCGVVSQGDAGTSSGIGAPPNYPNVAVAPGGTCFVAVAGVARVLVNTTVAALSLMSTDVTPGYAQSATAGTLGNLLAIALEANTAKDANNTIRVALKLG